MEQQLLHESSLASSYPLKPQPVCLFTVLLDPKHQWIVEMVIMNHPSVSVHVSVCCSMVWQLKLSIRKSHPWSALRRLLPPDNEEEVHLMSSHTAHKERQQINTD